MLDYCRLDEDVLLAALVAARLTILTRNHRLVRDNPHERLSQFHYSSFLTANKLPDLIVRQNNGARL